MRVGRGELTQDQPEGGVSEDEPYWDISGCLPPGLSDEPDVGQDHDHHHDGVEAEDGGDALPVWQQAAALCHLEMMIT